MGSDAYTDRDSLVDQTKAEESKADIDVDKG